MCVLFLEKAYPGFILFLLNLHNKIKDLLRRVLDKNPILGLCKFSGKKVNLRLAK